MTQQPNLFEQPLPLLLATPKPLPAEETVEDVSDRAETRPGHLWQCPRCDSWTSGDRCGWCNKKQPKPSA